MVIEAADAEDAPPTTEPTGLVIDDVGHVRVLRLDRPLLRNALSERLISALVDAVRIAVADHSVWVTVITGAGDAFCSGMDLKEAHERQTRDRAAVPRSPGLFEAVLGLPMPTIAALNGSAVAGGLELALACDIRICSSSAVLGAPEVTRGLVGNFAATILPRLVPAAVAYEMLYTGRYVSADEALRHGLVNRVVAREEVVPTALALAADIAANAPIAVRRTKARSTAGATLPVETAYRLDLGPDPAASEDRAEGIAAFVEKRPPRWKNA